LLEEEAKVTHKIRGQACGYPVSACFKAMNSKKNSFLPEFGRAGFPQTFPTRIPQEMHACDPELMHSFAHSAPDRVA
jgi:hypothetical protein